MDCNIFIIEFYNKEGKRKTLSPHEWGARGVESVVDTFVLPWKGWIGWNYLWERKNYWLCLGVKKGLIWVDENGKVFIYYSVRNICEILNCGTQKACKLLDELEGFGALERKRQGLGKPNKLYLKKVFWKISI